MFNNNNLYNTYNSINNNNDYNNIHNDINNGNNLFNNLNNNNNLCRDFNDNNNNLFNGYIISNGITNNNSNNCNDIPSNNIKNDNSNNSIVEISDDNIKDILFSKENNSNDNKIVNIDINCLNPCSSKIPSPSHGNNKVINLSSFVFPPSVFKVLGKGLNFSLAPKKIHVDDIICDVEFGIRGLPDKIKDTIRQDCVVVLRKAKPPQKNLSNEEFIALKSLNQNNAIVVLRADKGGATVILNKDDYRKKMFDHLYNSGSYKKLPKNPLKKISRMVALAIKSSSSVSSLYHKLMESSSITPRIYGLPKIHKEGAPLRPIVNTIGGPTYLLAKFLSLKLKPLVGHTESFVKDFAFFVKELKNIKLDPKDILVSFDVVSLYTCIPIKEAMAVIYRLTDPDTAHLVEICLTSTFFCFEGEFFEQTCGVAMGSPLSPIVANLFMEDFETRALASARLLPKLWKRYVDDTNVIWSHGSKELDLLFNHLNC